MNPDCAVLLSPNKQNIFENSFKTLKDLNVNKKIGNFSKMKNLAIHYLTKIKLNMISYLL
jgi:hypothetical protein